mgnify:FL=1
MLNVSKFNGKQEVRLKFLKFKTMKKLLFNRPLLVIISIVVLTGTILQTIEYIDLATIIIPLSLLYIIWLFLLIKSKFKPIMINFDKNSYEISSISNA